jgi:hypothetical protein
MNSSFKLVISILLLSVQALAYLHVDLMDVQKYQANSVPHLDSILNLLNTKWEIQSGKARARLSEIHHPENGVIVYKGHIHAWDRQNSGYFQKFSVQFKQDIRQIDFLSIDQALPITTLQFEVKAFIKPLVTQIEEKTHGIKIYIPFGGPGIDHGVTPRAHLGSVFMTPFFKGTLPRSKAISKRCEPAHYKCKPFIRLIPEGDDHSLYGYHTEPFHDQFQRGFVSAGCFRLQDSDLDELLAIIKFGANPAIPFEMVEDHPDLYTAHPLPTIMHFYEGVTRWRLKEGRIVFNSRPIKQAPPLSSVRFQTLKEVQVINRQTRDRFWRSTTDFFTTPN